MIKRLTEYLDYGFFAEIALAIFALVFIAVVVRTLLERRETSERHAAIVLDEKNQRDPESL